jgi:hypothetical protein
MFHNHDQAGEQEQPTAAGDDQRLKRSAARGLAMMIETDQQERRDRGQFPENEQHQKTVGRNQSQHRPHEHQKKREEPALMRMALQIATGIKHDQRANARDQQNETQRQTVDQP